MKLINVFESLIFLPEKNGIPDTKIKAKATEASLFLVISTHLYHSQKPVKAQNILLRKDHTRNAEKTKKHLRRNNYINVSFNIVSFFFRLIRRFIKATNL